MPTPTQGAGVDCYSRLKSVAQRVSSGCTKMVVLLSEPPGSELAGYGEVCHQLEQATLQLVAAHHQVPGIREGESHSGREGP